MTTYQYALLQFDDTGLYLATHEPVPQDHVMGHEEIAIKFVQHGKCSVRYINILNQQVIPEVNLEDIITRYLAMHDRDLFCHSLYKATEKMPQPAISEKRRLELNLVAIVDQWRISNIPSRH